jgi:hypothetical protein
VFYASDGLQIWRDKMRQLCRLTSMWRRLRAISRSQEVSVHGVEMFFGGWFGHTLLNV